MEDKLLKVRNDILKWRHDLINSEPASRALTVKNLEGLVVLGRLCAYRDTLKLINTTLRIKGNLDDYSLQNLV